MEEYRPSIWAPGVSYISKGPSIAEPYCKASGRLRNATQRQIFGQSVLDGGKTGHLGDALHIHPKERPSSEETHRVKPLPYLSRTAW